MARGQVVPEFNELRAFVHPEPQTMLQTKPLYAIRLVSGCLLECLYESWGLQRRFGVITFQRP
jgi:hypothetical protein